MSEKPFDLTAFAKKHRYRTRNLHDGASVPPAYVPGQPKPRPAFTGLDDRQDAIACKWGYVCQEDKRIGWALLCDTPRRMHKRLKLIEAISGVVVKQAGDEEAAGDAPPGAIEALLNILEPYRIAERPDAAKNLGSHAERIRTQEMPSPAPESTQRVSVVSQGGGKTPGAV